jgi:DNA-binding NarL/FixJ family response regulator
MTHSTKVENVIIADNQFLITESLKKILQTDFGFEVRAIVKEKSELLKVLNTGEISLLIVDHSLIDFSGLSDLKEIKGQFPNLRILILTNAVTRGELHDLNSAGIINILLKTEGKDEFFEAINAVIKGRKYYSNELLGLLFDTGERQAAGGGIFQLTNAEIEIVRLISDGFTTKEIASRKFISYHTVISHRKNIFRKLGVTSISELIMLAIRCGLINTIEYHI